MPRIEAGMFWAKGYASPCPGFKPAGNSVSFPAFDRMGAFGLQGAWWIFNSKIGAPARPGGMASLIETHDWSKSLGPIATWPQSLKTTVGLMIHSPVPMVLLWGADGIMIYNDAYSVFAGGRHPGNCWAARCAKAGPRSADLNDHVMKVCMAGGTFPTRIRNWC